MHGRTTYTDPTLRSNWAGMHAAGLARCAYHFGHPGTDAVAQANYFVAAVKAVGGCVHRCCAPWSVPCAPCNPHPLLRRRPLQLGRFEDAAADAGPRGDGRGVPCSCLGVGSVFHGPGQGANGPGSPPSFSCSTAATGDPPWQALTGRPGIIYAGYYFCACAYAAACSAVGSLTLTCPPPAACLQGWTRWATPRATWARRSGSRPTLRRPPSRAPGAAGPFGSTTTTVRARKWAGHSPGAPLPACCLLQGRSPASAATSTSTTSRARRRSWRRSASPKEGRGAVAAATTAWPVYQFSSEKVPGRMPRRPGRGTCPPTVYIPAVSQSTELTGRRKTQSASRLSFSRLTWSAAALSSINFIVCLVHWCRSS